MVSILTNSDNNDLETESQPMLEIESRITMFNNNNNEISNPAETSYHDKIELIWKDLTFKVKEREIKTTKGIPYKLVTKKRSIIENQQGRLVSGRLTAIIGPNGAGKTTLIECLGGRRKYGFTGQVFVVNNGSKRDIKFSYYSQKDILVDSLTVEETLVYCCQLKRCQNSITKSLKSVQHFEVEKLLNDFHLKKCSKTWAFNCSGGQKRRLSIALEMIFNPNILLLDEPTSGLDSVSSLQCIQLLKKTIKSSGYPMIIAVVIHQPNAKLLSYFDDIYALSSTGQCIYEGPTDQLVEKMSHFGLQCSQFCNPSDFALEIGSGDYGMDVIQKLAEHHNCSEEECLNEKEVKTEMNSIIESTRSHDIKEQISMTWPLTKRCLLINIKDPRQHFLQFFILVMMLGLVFTLHMDYKIGVFDSCIQKPSPGFIKNLTLGLFDIQDPEYSAYPNLSFLFYSMLFVVFCPLLPTVLSFPLEIVVLKKEYLNGWYSLSSYFVAKNFGDLPQNFIFPVIYSFFAYLITQQIPEMWRFLSFTAILILLSFLSQGIGFFVSALFADNVTGAVLVGAIINIPFLVFAGLLVKLQTLPVILKPMSYLSYYRLGFESLVLVIYGFNRCQSFDKITFSTIKTEFGDHIIQMNECVRDFEPELVGNFTSVIDWMNGLANKSVSYPLVLFDYNESNLIYNIIFIISYAFVLRIIAYILLVWKIKVK